MGFLDRAKEAAQRARSGARVAREQGQHRINELQARRQAEVLLREVGLASYEEKQGIGGQEAVVRAVAKLDEHVRAHNIDLSTSGLRGYLRTATGSGDDGSRVGRSPATATDAAPEATAAKDEPGTGDVPPDTAAEQPKNDNPTTADNPGGKDNPATEASSATKPATDTGSASKPATEASTATGQAADTGAASKPATGGSGASKPATEASTGSKSAATASGSTGKSAGTQASAKNTTAASKTTAGKKTTTAKKTSTAKQTSAAKKTTAKKTSAKKTASADGAGTQATPPAEGDQ
ncbi:MAG: hypothetical protein GEV07_22440 [Streptosporangiales bacterium]|nr:hypothetical protein [Streptosporangiales bacterium]